MFYYFCANFKNHRMKRLSILWLVVLGLGFVFQACNDHKTYAEMKEEERDAIKRYIELNDIKVISEAQFEAQDSTTNVNLNEYVLFKESGVYMQIIDKGNGELLKDGRYEVLARYVEAQITEEGIADTLSLNIWVNRYPHPDEFMLTKEGKSYSGTFSSGSMADYYGNSVPSAWMLPFDYLKVGRSIPDRSKIRLIVPHSEGTQYASSEVIPCTYEIIYQLAR